MMKVFVFILLGSPFILRTCTSAPLASRSDSLNEPYRVMFYNVENLFDIKDDTQTDDDAFTPTGKMYWTKYRYFEKINHIGKVILATGGWHTPDIIGLCEIENKDVLYDLVHSDALSETSYGIVHYESPDKRGIDVALLYKKNRVRFLSGKAIHIRVHDLITRDILYFKALLGNDTVHFFVNHWPSRSAGQLETENDRFTAAELLKLTCDSIMKQSTRSQIVIMGDFNDEPEDESIKQILGALPAGNPLSPQKIYNLSRRPSSPKINGSLKYQGNWNLFDQIMVSGSMLMNISGTAQVDKESFRILENDFLLEADRKYSGYKPHRTYLGFKYHGGFSDHLPVYIDIQTDPL